MALKLDQVGKPMDPVEFSYTVKDTILYNIGIGETQLKYVWEAVQGGTKQLPTFAVVPPFPLLALSVQKMGANPMTLLHGEQTVIIKKPDLPSAATVISEGVVTNVYDKGKGALYLLKTTTRTKEGEELYENIFSIFCRGEGGFGGDKGPEVGNNPPNRPPDFVHEEKTLPIQNLIYRLSGDFNPLHIDPNFAKLGGFDKPILHGLCTYGFVCRAVIAKVLGGDHTKVKEYFARFRGVVFPGDTLITSIWKESDNKVIVETKTQDGRVVIANASVTF